MRMLLSAVLMGMLALGFTTSTEASPYHNNPHGGFHDMHHPPMHDPHPGFGSRPGYPPPRPGFGPSRDGFNPQPRPGYPQPRPGFGPRHPW